MKKIYYLTRIITVAPIIALATLLILQIASPAVTGGWLNTLLGITFLSVFPALAYAIQPLIPYFKEKGREGQRDLAIIMSVIGYICSVAASFVLDMPDKLKVLFFTYLLSGLIMLILNKVVRVRSSGHACGVAGPIFYLIFVYGWIGLCGLPLLVLAYWSSLRMSRHKLIELIIGTMIPLAALLLSVLFIGLI